MTFLPFSRPSLGENELESIREVFASGWITTGPKNAQLEAEFCKLTGSPYAVAVCSATAGMHVTLLGLGLQPGDEVITPSMTWVSTVNIITLIGAKPVMVDIDRDNLMVSAEAIEAAITPRTKAIVPVHYAGAPADLDAIYQVADKYGIPVIEDAAHAAGTAYKGNPIGHKGTAIFSFHAIKNITCAEGGMVVTDNKALADRIRSLKFHGLGVDAFDRETHGRTPQAEVLAPGFKYNLADINAAIALSQLSKLTEINQRRAELAKAYRDAFTRMPYQPLVVPEWSHQHAWHLFIIRVDEKECGFNRDTLMEKLKAEGIGSGLHFRAAHTHKYYRQRYPQLSLPNSEWNSDRICSIPLFPDMTEQDSQRVITTLGKFVGVNTF